ncbi:MAG: hypothetical protein KBS62_00800 [Oscillospiraceae bacterium]|nr:hypothetical protein [Candidatus Ruminococcus equi]
MKKIILLLFVCLLVLSLCSCGGSNTPTESKETVLHTVAPTDAVTLEWCPVDCPISLADENGSTILSKEDFLTFAMDSTSNSTPTLRFKISELARDLLSTYIKSSPDKKYILKINSDDVAEVSDTSKLATSCEFSVSISSYEKCCELATKIRGL